MSKITMVDNIINIILVNEDITLCNLVQDYCMMNKDITYVGFTKDHPLDNHINMRIEMRDNVDMKSKMEIIIRGIIKTLRLLKEEFMRKYKEKC